MQHDGESSVEEILESIKKVIARDNRAGAAETRRRRSTKGVSDEVVAADDVEVTEDVLELGEAEIVEDGDVSEELTAEDAPLIADGVRDSMRDNLAALSMLAQPGAQPQIVRSGETSLEGMVRDMLRPMLAEWLDANLPEMTERIVRAEISRIAGKRG